jgi:hypothetical protein
MAVRGLSLSSVHRSARDDPFRGLAGDGGDDVEVAVVVENGETRRGRSGGDQEVGDSCRPMSTGLDKVTLGGAGELFDAYWHDDRNESIEKGQHRIVIGNRTR